MQRITRWLDITIFCGFALYVLVFGARTPYWWAGMALVAICLPFWIWARVTLGASFSVRPEARHLVTSGLYSRFRHPVYVFGTPAVIGLLMAYLGFGALVFVAIIVPVELVRARREEAGLEAAFGEEYRAYRERTWF